ncbi:MAG TPA: hypothetical protein VFY98_10730 [Intrasporangium sp.]|nr:hypothetical protein [Intrasporangium sp.]
MVAALLLASTTAYVLVARKAQLDAAASAPEQPTTSAEAIGSGPRIMFRNTAIGPDYGRVAMVPLDAPGGSRAFVDLSCDRITATRLNTLCLASDLGVVTTFTAKVYPAAGKAPVQLPLSGSPSRARLSKDGWFAATTSFVAGDSYAQAGFSTRTVVTALAERSSHDLESFRLVHEGKHISPTDRNYWGVSFAADDDSFFVTVAFGEATYLAKGRMSTRTIDTIRTDAECPSLSPDESRVAYKKRGDRAPGDWRIAVLDLTTGKETILAEKRSVDDQVEWLDDDRIIYGLPGAGADAAQSNVWVTNADGTGSPEILLERAWSPAVIR